MCGCAFVPLFTSVGKGNITIFSYSPIVYFSSASKIPNQQRACKSRANTRRHHNSFQARTRKSKQSPPVRTLWRRFPSSVGTAAEAGRRMETGEGRAAPPPPVTLRHDAFSPRHYHTEGCRAPSSLPFISTPPSPFLAPYLPFPCLPYEKRVKGGRSAGGKGRRAKKGQ